MSRPLRRRLRLLEREWPWVLWAMGTGGVLGVIAVAIVSGVLQDVDADFFYRALRGYTPFGITLGVVAIAFVALASVYSFRKRSLQEWMPFRGTLMMWMSAHVWLGLLALVAAFLHAGFGAFSLQLSTGKLLLFFLAGLVFTGLVWRLVYKVLPRFAAKAIGSYSGSGAAIRAEEVQVELDKIGAGRSPRFHELSRWVADQTPSEEQVRQAAAELPQAEQPALAQVARLTASRNRAIARQSLQSKYTRRLQGWRILHVPLTLGFFVVLPIHIVGAFDLPAKMIPMGAAGGLTFGGFETSEACVSCHKTIVEQWRRSMHSHAMTSPIMIAQTNQVVRTSLRGASSPDPLEICVNCHGPLGAALSEQATLPLTASMGDEELLNEGVSCAVCHQWDGTPATGGAGLTAFQDGLRPGRTYFGPIKDPVPNAFHKSEFRPLFDRPSELCRNCHSVQYDKDGDGKFVKGKDLVLQTLFDEWKHYDRGASCVTCHMPVLGDETEAADSAVLVLEQDYPAPNRRVRDHSFVGPDYPLDVPYAQDPLRERRALLLRRAAKIDLDAKSIETKNGTVSFQVSIENTGTAHNLPGGFAFVRQMWFEVRVEDRKGRTVGSSGVLAKNTDDLCDGSTMDEVGNPMANFIEGCDESDPQLVNFQQKLVDKVEVAEERDGSTKTDDRGEPVLAQAEDGAETWLQFLTGGAVARKRGADKKPVPALYPGEERKFKYAIKTSRQDLDGGTVRVKLWFRPVPPYFLRALASAQPPGEKPQIAPLVGNVHAVEMASVSAAIKK